MRVVGPAAAAAGRAAAGGGGRRRRCRLFPPRFPSIGT